ncbi:MAG: (Fe-S)-binding protein, partial [Planctomycetes bacterium]|nr:(Fe-S)-binding protein [Planctomycetota bacterium]
LTEHGIEPPTHAIAERVTYHHACHLCHGQGIRQQPQHLLKLIPGLELVDLKEADWCCGAAGTYSLTQPDMANRLARRKLQNIDETHSQIVATANAGCILHLRQQAIETGRDVHIVHPIDLLDRAYGPSDERC